ncbi:STAS domain-containing protein [Actinomadura parmotrematis]|uniref:STAS domain-containing protein n=1 Tax=Actinomadura parmotrematis TaxID=2864039 RepID=A0ABS7FUS0_9ACTN|nr:STAS domain-containing protein [Actinomadura parmotrematis]MBW8484143.1 STAS domain-containing protein [Actinomadura parmotrematis]
MTTPLTLALSRRGDGRRVLTAVGEIDMSNVARFAAELAGTSDGAPLVVDLTGVGYLDSAGLAALFAHAAHVELVATPLLEPVLTVSGLTTLLTVHGLDGAGRDGDGRDGAAPEG